MEQRETFVAEGQMQMGPSERFFIFLDGEYLGELLMRHFRLPEERGYTDVGACASPWRGWRNSHFPSNRKRRGEVGSKNRRLANAPPPKP
jgi:hypothetical protein